MRGEHRLAQATAETFLREAEEGEYATEASVARPALGSTCLARGNLIQARTYLERALEEYVPARDTQARFRFGHDPGEAAAAYLALAVWHLGEVERARRLAEQAVQLAAELGHVPASANAHALEMFLETRRDDLGAALRSAEVLLALVQGRGMELYVAACPAFAGWAR
jgi:tetratricopeptide (TPR) repeat protein